MNAPSRLLRIIHRSPLNCIRRYTQGVAALFALAFAAAACGDDPVDPDLEPPAVSPDRDVLVALYNATDGGNWRRNTNWLSDAPVDEWHGVSTDDGGRVRRLMLSTNGLQGPLPAVLAELPELRFLALAGNELYGPLPPELGSLQQVDSLFLNNNRLTGIIPGSFLQLDGLDAFRFGGNEGLCVPVNSAFGAWAESIAHLDGPDCAEEDARVLRLLHDVTTGPQWTNAGGWNGEEPLSEWYGVETDSIGRVMSLRLAGNGLSGTLPESLAQLSGLRHLDLADNDLGGRLPASLAALALEHFRYSGTELCVPQLESFQRWLGTIASHEGSGISCPPSPRSLLVAFYEATHGDEWAENQNWLTDAPLAQWYGVSLGPRGELIGLSLPFNGVRGPIPPELGAMTSLRLLNLRGNWGLEGPLPESFFNLAELEWLGLFGVGLGGPMSPEFGKLTRLQYLDLARSGLGGPLPTEIGNLTDLEVLLLGGNAFVGEIPPEIGDLQNLRYLIMWYNDFSGGIPAEMGGLTSLVELDLRGSGVTGAIPAELGNLTNLEELWLSGNELTGSIPPTLGNMTSLKELYMHQNNLEGPLPAEFGRLPELEQLWLGGNEGLSGPLPGDLGALDQLRVFKAGGTGLCAPAEPEFLAWLDGVRFQRVARCADAPAAYLTQAVQSREFPVPLIANRDALLRVFVSSTGAAGESMPNVRATFYHDGVEAHVAEIPRGHAPIPTQVDEGTFAASANAIIPGGVLRPGLEMVVEIDPEGELDPALGIVGRIPETGRAAVSVRGLPDFPLTLVPFLYASNPDRSILALTQAMAADPGGHEMLRHTRELLPAAALDVTLHAPVTTSSESGFAILTEVELIRRMESDGPGYWLAMKAPVPTIGLLGVAFDIPSWSSYSVPMSSTIAHELGHNLGLYHAPCGGAGGPDPLFPDRNGRIGSWGYDHTNDRLITPYAPDLMSYCGGGWIGDYHFSNALRHRVATEVEAAASFGGKKRSVLVWGGRDADGKPFLEPALLADALPSSLPTGHDYRLVGRTAEGVEVFSFTFDMPYIREVEDERSSFVFAIPVTWSGELATISLGDGRTTVRLDKSTDSPITILRDPLTGQVRAILRKDQAAAMDAVGEPGLVPVFSRGIPEDEVRRR